MSGCLTRRHLFGQAMAAMATVPLIDQLPDTHELACLRSLTTVVASTRYEAILTAYTVYP